MTSITLDGATYDFILEFGADEASNVAIPEWINQDPEIDTNVWSKEKEIITYTLKVTESERNTLRTSFLKHTLVKLTDGMYGISNEDVWMASMDEDGYSHFWIVTIDILRP